MAQAHFLVPASVKIINEEMTLMHLLRNEWEQASRSDFDLSHLLVNCDHDRFEVITPTDFLRFLFFIVPKNSFLNETQASLINKAFDGNERFLVHSDDDVWLAFHRLCDNNPDYLMTVVDSETGTLEATLSAVDFLLTKVAEIENADSSALAGHSKSFSTSTGSNWRERRHLFPGTLLQTV